MATRGRYTETMALGLDPELAARLRDWAWRRRQSFSAFAREAIREKIERLEREQERPGETSDD